MAYLGNSSVQQNFGSRVDTFNGDGSTLTFTLSRPVGSATDIEVVVDNVQQQPNVAYTAQGTTLTFTGAPLSGTGNIYVNYPAMTVTANVPPTKSVNPAALSTGGPSWDANGKLVVNNTVSGGQTTQLTNGNPNDGNFQLQTYNGSSNTAGSIQAQLGLFYAGVGENSVIRFKRGSNTQDGSLVLATNTLDRMTIDSGGRVLMPYQPAFHVQHYLYNLKNWATTDPLMAVGNSAYAGTITVLTNIGNCFSTASGAGTFTAPVAGTYALNGSFSRSGGNAIAQLSKNGSTVATQFLSYGTDWQTVTVNYVLTLAAGDYVQMMIGEVNTTAVSGYNSSFSGHLIG